MCQTLATCVSILDIIAGALDIIAGVAIPIKIEIKGLEIEI